MKAGYSGTPLQQKLGMRPGSRVSFVDPPTSFADQFADIDVLARLRAPLDVIVIFAVSMADLSRHLPAARRALAPHGSLWVAWPKRSSGVTTDLSENVVRDAITDDALVDNKVCAIDHTWSGLRFVYRRSARP